MSYKSSNKTIFSSVLAALMCLWTHSASSQNLFDTEQSAEVPAPASEDVTFEIEDDIIPLNEEDMIVPEQKEQSEVKADDSSQTDSQEANEQKAEQAPADDKNTEETVSQPEEIAAPQDEIQAPAEDTQDDFLDDFEIKFDEDSTTEQNDLFNESDSEIQAESSDTNEVKAAAKSKKAKDLAAKPQISNGVKFGDSILAQTNNDLFNQMSDIEKQTTLLTLELKRERIRNEVEAAKAVREKAELEKIAQEEEKARQQAEWKKEQEIKVIKAQEELKQKEIELEKIKQRKALTAYMNSMLEQKQSWIAENSKLYEEIRNLKETNSTLRTSYKGDLSRVQEQAAKMVKSAEIARNNYERAVASLSAQNAQLRKRMESMEKSMKEGSSNPLADKPAAKGNQISTSADTLIKPINIAKEYAIMEITGQNDDLVVKLINKEGDSFVAKTGTILQTGHMVEEITPHYVQFDRNGLKDFLYTANSALSMEPKKMSDEPDSPEVGEDMMRPRATIVSDDSLPSVGDSMFIK